MTDPTELETRLAAIEEQIKELDDLSISIRESLLVAFAAIRELQQGGTQPVDPIQPPDEIMNQ